MVRFWALYHPPLDHPQPSHHTQSLINFLSPWICLFHAYHINGFLDYVTFCDWLLSPSIIFTRFIHTVAFPYFFIPLYCQILFHCMDRWHFIHSVISSWMFELFQSLGCYDKYCCEIHVQIFVYLGYTPRKWLVGSYGNAILGQLGKF